MSENENKSEIVPQPESQSVDNAKDSPTKWTETKTVVNYNTTVSNYNIIDGVIIFMSGLVLGWISSPKR